MFIKKLLILGTVVMLVVFSGQVAWAQDAVRVQKTQTIRTAPAVVRDARPVDLAQRCQVIKQRFDVQIDRYGLNVRQHTLRYERMQARLNVLVTRLNQAGKDTSELEAALVVLDEKIGQFIHNAATYIESLKLAQEFACDETETRLLGKVTETRSLLQLLRADVADIKSYWQEVLRPMIAALIDTVE
jgi:hypothetical protein